MPRPVSDHVVAKMDFTDLSGTSAAGAHFDVVELAIARETWLGVLDSATPLPSGPAPCPTSVIAHANSYTVVAYPD